MIHFRNDVPRSGVDVRALKKTAGELLAHTGRSNSSLSLSLVDDKTIQSLNKRYRSKDAPTDVLSFGGTPPLGDAEHSVGDVVISIDTARRQADGYHAPLQSELYRLLIHGILHLAGHDHETEPERTAMEAEERRLAQAIGMAWPYD